MAERCYAMSLIVSFAYAECHFQAFYVDYRYVECRYAECSYAECRLSVVMVSVIMLCYAECHNAECRHADCSYSVCCYTECHYGDFSYAECHYADYRYADCSYAECHYADFFMNLLSSSAGVISGDSSNVVELVRQQYETITTTIKAEHNARCQYYKAFFGRNFRILVIRWSVCSWRTFLPQSNVCK
jgi:hypothetical protein